MICLIYYLVVLNIQRALGIVERAIQRFRSEQKRGVGGKKQNAVVNEPKP